MPQEVTSTSEKKKKWSDDAERLILYADIMGFSHRVTYQNHKELKAELQKFFKALKRKIAKLPNVQSLKYVQFSDSILFVVNGKDIDMFNLITKASVCLMQTALRLGFPIKGVLAQGMFSYDEKNELYFGLPLVEAYHLHNEIYYYGVVVHHSAEQTVKSYSDSTKPYSKTLISLKKGKTSHYHLSWHRLKANFNTGNIKNKANEWLNKIEEGVSGEPRIYVDNTREVLNNDNKEWENVREKDSLE